MRINIDWGKFDSSKYKPLYKEEIPNYGPSTLAYQDYWDEQDRRCLEGYSPVPYMPKITGAHYFYLNMCKIRLLKPGDQRKTTASPFYRELDRRLFNEIDDARKNKHGLIVGKPRRVGLSYVGSVTTLHEMLMHKEVSIGVAAGQENKAADFYDKVKKMHEDIRPEYRSSVLVENDGEYTLGYKTYENKQHRKKGLLSSMYIQTMYANPSGFEGKSFEMAIFEEAGLFVDLIAAYKATEPCFKEGSIMFGCPIVYGTGGDIEKDSKGYMKMWQAPREAYNLKKVLVLATDYYPGDGIPDPKTGKSITFFDMKTGRTNGEEALKHILAERKAKEGQEGFIKHIQSYPIKEEEIFIKTSGGYLNRKKLNAQIQNLANCPYLQKQGRFEWKTEDPTTIKLVARAKNLKEIDKIHYMRGSKVVFVEDDQFGTVWKIMDPIKNHGLSYCPDVCGIDSYDEEIDKEAAKKKISNGATLVYRTFYSPKMPYDLPIMYILDRGDATADDTFFSQNVRAAVAYGYKPLVEYTKVAIINYFRDVGAYGLLMERPVIEGYNSSASNPVGFKMPNQHAWRLTLRLLKREVNENYNNIWFLEVLIQLINYGEENADLGSAYAMALVAKLSIFPEETEGIEYDDRDSSYLLDMDTYVYEDGKLVTKSIRELTDPNSTNDFKNLIQEFNPEIDYDDHDHKKYLDQIELQKKKRILDREKVLKQYDNDPLAFSIKEFLEDNRKNT